MLGRSECQALGQVEQCYRQHGMNWSQYALSLAQQNFDPKTAVAVECLRQQVQSANTSAWAVAGCIAGQALQLNPEQTVALECAMASGGEPMAFAGCTGGRLATMELNKCFTYGVGGHGCFGDNNEIVKGLRALGVDMDMDKILGPNRFGVRAWKQAVNDLQHGPGPNNTLVKAIDTINNDLRKGMGKNNDIRKVMTKIGLGGLF